MEPYIVHTTQTNKKEIKDRAVNNLITFPTL